jgi:hypothetical protein
MPLGGVLGIDAFGQFLPKPPGASRCFSKMASVRAANFDNVGLWFLDSRFNISEVVAQICIQTGKFDNSFHSVLPFRMWT